MKCTLFALLLFFPLPVLASSSFEDAFQAYVKMKQVEEKLAVNEINSKLDSVDKESNRQELLAAQTEAKIAFHGVSRSDQDQLDPWENAILERVQKEKPAPAKASPEALAYLQAHFKDAKNFSALEWKVVQEWFGQDAQEKFLSASFSLEELKKSSPDAEKVKIVWILDPFRKLLPTADSLEKSDLSQLKAEIETVEISSFASVEEQAEQLRHFLISKGDEPFVLVSSGEASAVVNKLLDLHPSLRVKQGLQGWINVNGRLYGKTSKTEKSNRRKLASVKSPIGNGSVSRAEQFENEALLGLRLLHLESLERQPPLGQGFPIINLVSLEEKFRPAKNLREALVTDGVFNRFVRKGPAWKAIGEVLPLVNVAQ